MLYVYNVCDGLFRFVSYVTERNFLWGVSAGEGEVVCDKCNGNGNLAHGGYHKRNLVTLNRIVGEFLFFSNFV